jgi:hypothetical protein
LGGSKEETDQHQPGMGSSSFAHETIRALREIGLLDDIINTKEGIVVYPREMNNMVAGI